MNQSMFSRCVGVSAAAVAALGALAVQGCGSNASSSPTAVAETGQSEEALRGARRCDGPRNRKCPDGQYCNAVVEGRCPGRRHPGVCADEPQICPDIFQPVCGCDDVTYPNSCNAAAAGVAVVHDGACATKRTTCGGIAGIPCPGGGKCVDDPTDSCDPANGGADCGGICTCVETQLCVQGSHFDGDPSVCACVPDKVCVQTVLCIRGDHFDSDPAVCACVPDAAAN